MFAGDVKQCGGKTPSFKQPSHVCSKYNVITVRYNVQHFFICILLLNASYSNVNITDIVLINVCNEN